MFPKQSQLSEVIIDRLLQMMTTLMVAIILLWAAAKLPQTDAALI